MSSAFLRGFFSVFCPRRASGRTEKRSSHKATNVASYLVSAMDKFDKEYLNGWSPRSPKEPGWYWLQREADKGLCNNVECVRVTGSQNDIAIIKNGEATPLREVHAFLWYGPVTPPPSIPSDKDLAKRFEDQLPKLLDASEMDEK
jgi:hypothetical protein